MAKTPKETPQTEKNYIKQGGENRQEELMDKLKILRGETPKTDEQPKKDNSPETLNENLEKEVKSDSKGELETKNPNLLKNISSLIRKSLNLKGVCRLEDKSKASASVTPTVKGNSNEGHSK